MKKRKWLILLLCSIIVAVAVFIGWRLTANEEISKPLDMKDEDFETEIIPWDDQTEKDMDTTEGEMSPPSNSTITDKVQENTDENSEDVESMDENSENVESTEENDDKEEEEVEGNEEESEITLPYVPFD